jgi:hypothetical protein
MQISDCVVSYKEDVLGVPKDIPHASQIKLPYGYYDPNLAQVHQRSKSQVQRRQTVCQGQYCAILEMP